MGEAEVRYQRTPAVVEQYRVRGAAGVEQVFTLAETPRAAAGHEPADLVVRGRVETGLDGRPDGEGGLTFTTGARPQVSFGRAVAIDAGGRVADCPIAYAAGVLEIRVPGEWLAQAPAGPLVIDPLVGANVALGPYFDEDVHADLAYGSAQEELLLAHVNDGTLLVVSRLSPTDGTILDAVVLDFSGDR